MISPEDLIEFVLQEQRHDLEQQNLRRLFSRESIVDKGYAVNGLMALRQQGAEVWLNCLNNESRLRPGSKVSLESGDVRLRAEILAIENSGSTFHLRLSKREVEVKNGPWFLIETNVDFTQLIVNCIKKNQPGAPGWSYFKTLAGDHCGKSYQKKKTDEAKKEQVLTDVIHEFSSSMNRSQIDAVRACVNEPAILGIQGPPGTGKTMVLSLVAEAFARLGRRVLILAPTHQAVNNALASIRSIFSSRMLIKIGSELRRESLPDSIECKVLKDAINSRLPQHASELITGMTFLSALQHLALRTSGLAPNVVLIDEAGQLPLAQGICGGLLGAGSALLFGDDAQMPPVFSVGVAGHPVATSLFARYRHVHPESILMLDTTYRLNDELCEFIEDGFYENATHRLIPSREAAPRRLRLNAPDRTPRNEIVTRVFEAPPSVIWVRMARTYCRQSNMDEADFLADVVAQALSSGVKPDQIAVVTPFRRQSSIVRFLLQKELENADCPIPVIDTVERVQGLTVELVLYSLCVTDPDYASEIASFLFSPNRLNVAASRARTKVIMTVCPEILTIIPPDYSGFMSLRKFANAMKRAGECFDLNTDPK